MFLLLYMQDNMSKTTLEPSHPSLSSDLHFSELGRLNRPRDPV